MRVSARQVKKTYGNFTALESVAVDFEPGKIHAVLGENGAGKSTLLKILFGLIKPDQGQVEVDGVPLKPGSPFDAIARGLGMVQQHFTLVDNLTVLENIMVGAEKVRGPLAILDRAAIKSKLEGVLAAGALRVPWDKKVGDLSVGQKQRVEILKLLFRDAHILFLDEPTAVLAPEECAELFQILRRLKAEGRTIVLITHKLSEVMDVCDTYTVLRRGRVTASGDVEGTTRETMIEAMIGRALESFPEERSTGHGVQVCKLEKVEAQGLKQIDLSLRAGEIVGIAGVEGSGQSELVRLLLGLNPLRSGRAEVLGARLETPEKIRARGVGLIPEDRLREGIWLAESCSLNLGVGLENQFANFGWIDKRARRAKGEAWAKSFDVRMSSHEVPVKALSGGNQQKLVYAREVEGRRPKLLIAHQPSRGVDLGAMDLIHRRLLELREQGLAVLILSNDLDEVLKLADRVYVFYSGKVTGEFARGHFDRVKIGAAMTGVAK